MESSAEPVIQLYGVTKQYRGTETPAVDDLSMTIDEGDIVMLIGPSGCGKTTTMKMINRLIEPTGGQIIVNGQNVMDVNENILRRHIGYVIQQIGLFPHMTIKENIAVVPKLLNWDKQKIGARVDELLEMVSIDPGEYRDRYPKELSGGQRQRIGVARAMAVDPPVLLMDEPFGAIDPITRDKLQNEFLRLQEEINKTIVFVTHDIDEAIKMGDKICILREGGIIAQYASPEEILSNPVDDFVADFIGSGATLKRLNLERVRDYDLREIPTFTGDAAAATVLEDVRKMNANWALGLDAQGRPERWVSRRELGGASGTVGSIGIPVESTLDTDASMHDALDALFNSTADCAVAIDRHGAYSGALDLKMVMGVIDRLQAEQQAREVDEGSSGNE